MVGVVQDGLGGHSGLRDALQAEWSAGVEVLSHWGKSLLETCRRTR
jgi:hypothetical protein